jgi:hypothetical protein
VDDPTTLGYWIPMGFLIVVYLLAWVSHFHRCPHTPRCCGCVPGVTGSHEYTHIPHALACHLRHRKAAHHGRRAR